jgi:hypothetical protein
MEKKRYKEIIRSSALPEDPLIIIGSWRTGSTYLHELLKYDPNGTTPTMYQVHIPDSFLFSAPLYKSIMKFMMGKKTRRPFDNMLFNADSPQEDEFAMLKMSIHSPLIKLIYPENDKFFLLNYKNFDLQGKEYEDWEIAMTQFCKKIHLLKKKRIILKNPFHTMRLQNLLTLFPKAKFIHIYRNPLDVIPSTVKMWNIVGEQNSLKPGFVKASIQSVTEVYDQMQMYLQQNIKNFSKSSFCEIRYEDLEKDPALEIKKAYQKLELAFDKDFEDLIVKNQVKNFRKNRFNLSAEEKSYICNKLEQHMEQYGYATNCL